MEKKLNVGESRENNLNKKELIEEERTAEGGKRGGGGVGVKLVVGVVMVVVIMVVECGGGGDGVEGGSEVRKGWKRAGESEKRKGAVEKELLGE